jgi:uncharacterized protein
MTAMFVNLPVTDLERAKAFYTAIGFTINPALHGSQRGLRRRRGRPQLLHDPDARLLPELYRPADRRPGGDGVGGDLDHARQPGGCRRDPRRRHRRGRLGGATPATNLGFMYQRQLTDPDGHVLEFGYMDPVAAEQGPQVFMNQQA